MLDRPLILGIETSCDDTAAAVVANGRLISNVRAAQRVHEGFGGVVPELASRAHQRLIVPVVDTALQEAGIEAGDLDAVAVTYGPGLAGSLLVGLSFAKALALSLDVPLLGVNHLEGHVYSVFIEEPHPPFPYLCLTVSGGHTQLDVVRGGFVHEPLGRTRDDAAGEAFDKVAKMLGLGYPGGPVIDRLAADGDPRAFDFPRTRLANENGLFDFSFSGIKTAVLYTLSRMSETERKTFLSERRPDVAASFQQAVVDVLVGAIRGAVRAAGVSAAAVVGGVAANRQLRAAAEAAAAEDGFELFVPRLEFSMDNAAMIAVTAHFKLAAGHSSPLTLTAEPSLALGIAS
jgi:N6-L-threonylcarbamoyladenine synthase